MPWNFILRTLTFTISIFLVTLPAAAVVFNVFWDFSYPYLPFFAIVGAIGGLFHGIFLLSIHFSRISKLAGEVNESTVRPVTSYTTSISEKVEPAMTILQERLQEKGWKLKSARIDEGMLFFSMNKHRSITPIKSTIKITPKTDGTSLLQATFHLPLNNRVFPDMGWSMQYLKELKTALL